MILAALHSLLFPRLCFKTTDDYSIQLKKLMANKLVKNICFHYFHVYLIYLHSLIMS